MTPTEKRLREGIIAAGNAGDAESVAILAKQLAVEKAKGYAAIPEERGLIDAVTEEGARILGTSIAKASDAARDLIPGMSALSWVSEKVLPKQVHDAYFDAEDLLTDAGLTPETTGGKVAAEIIPAVAGGFAAAPVGLAAAGRVANIWGKRAITSVVDSVAGQHASGHDVSAGTTAGDAALGTAIQAALPRVGRGIRWLLRGEQQDSTLQAADVINDAVTGSFTPTRAMLTGSKPAAFMERHLESTLFGGGTMRAATEANDAALNEFADVLRKRMEGDVDTDAAELGEALQEGFKRFVQSGSDEGEKYFGTAIQRAGNHRIGINELRRELNRVMNIAKANPGFEKAVMSSDYKQIADMAAENARGVTLEGAIRIKGMIRRMMDDPGVGLKGNNDRDLALIYAALDNDITKSLNAAPMGALGAWQEGNRQWSKFQDDLSALRRLFDGDADSVYNRVFGAPDKKVKINGFGRIQRLLDMMPADTQRRIKAEIVFRAGRESLAQAGNEGQKFSAAAFLTNWGALKANGFDRLLDEAHRADIEALALISSRMKDLGRAGNFSNTANHLTAANLMNGLAFRAGALLTFGMDNLTARAMTNPEFARRAVEFARDAQTGGERSRALVRLIVLMEQDPGTENDVDAFLDAIEAAESQPAK